MANYLKSRVKSYIFILLGLGVGVLICEMSMENPDYLTGGILFLIGFVFGEYSMIKRWMKGKNK
ncbi:hypothetical protein MOF21_21615 [Bacillus haynesii]|uniref:hypothetical protein n=1 Tax=Bacillus haynesii TaxID=1925021 RepID=UPI00227E41D4|nr:hypothetical protein [Bacillus haynesii]MCY9332473.1 hypothetical protein [Bacillus haynesii]